MQKCKNCQAVLPDKPEGKLGRNQVFCNSYCGKLFRGEIKILDKPVACLWCNAVLDQRGAGNPKKFCSRKHAADYRQANFPKPKVPQLKLVCLFCFTDFMSNRKQARFCSALCRATYYQASKKAKRESLGARVYSAECDRCKQLIVSDSIIGTTVYGRFCRPCALVRRRERYRIKTAKRQKVMNPLRISADVLIERDGNLCHICNQEIDLSLARNSRFGATIDHVIPLSKGGVDELANLKLAHWICNIKKGNRI
jgi:5-methylcytosine-specific restriction endonuclease McrA